MTWFAYYDSKKDKIIGAKPDTLVYYHEEGHRQQFKNGTGQFINMWGGYFLIATVWFLAMDAWWVWTTASAIIMMYLLLFFLEIDAWFYAFTKMKERKKNGF